MAVEQICPIWGTHAEVKKKGDSLIVDSPSAGGKYKITTSAETVLQKKFNYDEKIKLTDWLVEKRKAGVKEPEIDSETLERQKTRPTKKMQERIKSFMLFLAEKFEVDGEVDGAEQICPIWGTPAEIELMDDEYYAIDSPRVGGKYRINSSIVEVLHENLTDDKKIKLTDWLIEEREKGAEEPPYIDEKILEDVKARSKKRIQERIDNLMLFLARRYEIGDSIETQKEDVIMMLTAHSSSLTEEEAFGFLRHCASEGYLEVLTYRISSNCNPQEDVSPPTEYISVKMKMIAGPLNLDFRPTGYIDLQVDEAGKVYHMTVAGKMYAEEISKKEK